MKTLFLLLIFSLFSISIYACPFCGCGNSNFQIGVLPTFSKGFAGVRYSYTHFNTDAECCMQFSRDYYHTTEVWGGYTIGKVQVMAFLPYISIHHSSDDGVVNANGLGDAILIGNYQLFSKTKSGSAKKRMSNTVWLGGGVKFATGKSLVNVNNPDFTVGDFTAVPGTGSTDFMVLVNHNFMVGNNGIVTTVTYRINTKNAQQFQYGNRMYINTLFFHSWTLGRYVVRPLVGLNFVENETNRFQKQDVPSSQSYVLEGMTGVNLQRGKIGLLLNGSLPITQNIYHGFTQFKERASVALTYSF